MSSRSANRPSSRARLVVGAESAPEAEAPEVPWSLSNPTEGAPSALKPTAPATTLTGPTPAGEAPAFLYVEKGPGAGQLVPLRQGTLVIGRGSGADLRLVHPSISRKHAAVTRDGEQFFVRDFGSQNGTFVNQLRSPQEMELFPGDELAIGNAVLRLRSRADQDEAPTTGRVTTGLWLSGVSRSSSGLLMLVMAAAISLGLVAALGWALFAGPPTPTMQPEPVAAAPQTEPVPAAAPPAKQDEAASSPAVDHAAVAQAAKEEAALRETEARREREALAAAAAAARTEEAPAPRPSRAEPVQERAAPRSLDDAYARASAAPSEPVVESRPPPAPRPAPAPKPTNSGAMSREVLAAYESGNVDRALTLARSANESASVTKLQNFQQAYVAGNRAIAQRDGVGAIRNFARALKVDESISKGWGTYGPELRGRLATLYVAAGRQRNQQGDTEGARDAFRAALKYDPKNAEAKQAAALLGE